MGKNRRMLLIAGILLVIFGIFALIWPVSTLIALNILFGIIIVASGITAIIMAFSNMKTNYWGWILAGGIIDVIFGIIILCSPFAATFLFTTLGVFIVSLWAIVRGIVMFCNCFASKKNGNTSWWVDMICGILLVIAGFLFLFYPLSGALTLEIMLAIITIIAGIAACIFSFKVKSMK